MSAVHGPEAVSAAPPTCVAMKLPLLALAVLAILTGSGRVWAQGAAIPNTGTPLITDLSAHLIAIRSNFTGTSLLIFGAIEEQGDIVVVVRGPPDTVTVRKKDRVAGMWLNRESVSFTELPAYYNLIASRPLFEIASVGLWQRLRIGADNLRYIPTQPLDDAELARFRDAVIRVRNEQKLFQQAGTVTFLGPKLFRAQVDFPAIVPVGVYRVEVYLIRDERVIAAQAIPLFINKTGFEREIFAFAHEHALYYGAASVVLAMMIGWLAALVMRRN